VGDEMIVKLASTQIKDHWESIKFSAVKADMVQEKDVPDYSLNLLLDLLNAKAQCIMSIEDGKILRILIISFMYDVISKKKSMVFRTMYSFTLGTEESWVRESTAVYQYAKKMNCTEICMTTMNPRIVQLAERYGMSEISKNYSVNI
jgi:hypothetical protein